MGAAWLHFPLKVTVLPGLSVPSLGPLSTPSRAERNPGAFFFALPLGCLAPKPSPGPSLTGHLQSSRGRPQPHITEDEMGQDVKGGPGVPQAVTSPDLWCHCPPSPKPLGR